MRLAISIIFALLVLSFTLAQPPRTEDEDPKAKTVKPIDIESFPKDKDKPKAPEPPGVAPGRGTLVIGVKSLPERMSPTRARTASERWACDLIFEGLVRPTSSEAGTVYEPALAEGPPRVEAGGRTVDIDPAARWTDADRAPVLANDVLTTIEKMRSAEATDLFSEAFSDAPRRVRLMYRSATPDPTAWLTFRIVPSHLPDDESFARKPVGSGPFMFSGVVTQGGRQYVVFAANPQYSQRINRGTLPQLKEVRLLAGADPLADFRKGLVDVLVEERTRQLAGPTPAPIPGSDMLSRLESSLGPTARVITRPSRRIYYLAFNPLKTVLGGDAGTKLRRALAFAIQRDEILNTVWRVDGQSNHRALTGPFPTDTWAWDPDTQSLDDKTLAAAELRVSPAPKDPLLLIFPNDDTLAGPSCQRIQDQLREAGFQIESRGLAADEYNRAVAEKSFDLAYRIFDFRDDWFDSTALFSLSHGGIGSGSGSARLESALARSAGRGEFAALRDARRRLHREFREVMPFVPLWSPDLHIVLRKAVETAPAPERLDPHAPFTNIDRWRVNR